MMREEYIAPTVLLIVLVFLPAVCLFVTRQAAEGLITRDARPESAPGTRR